MTMTTEHLRGLLDLLDLIDASRATARDLAVAGCLDNKAEFDTAAKADDEAHAAVVRAAYALHTSAT